MADKYGRLEKLLNSGEAAAWVESHMLSEVNRIIADIKDTAIQLNENYGAFENTYLTTSEKLKSKDEDYLNLLNSKNTNVLNALVSEMNARLLVLDKEEDKLLVFGFRNSEDGNPGEEGLTRIYELKKLNHFSGKYPIYSDALNEALGSGRKLSGRYNRIASDRLDKLGKMEAASVTVLTGDSNEMGLEEFFYLTTPELLNKASPGLYKYVMSLNNKPVDQYARTMYGPMFVLDKKHGEVATLTWKGEPVDMRLSVTWERAGDNSLKSFESILMNGKPGTAVTMKINSNENSDMYA